MDNFDKLNLKRLKIPISVEYTLDDSIEILPVSYLSQEGMFIETSVSYEIGVNLVIKFYIPDFDKVVEIVGEVVSRETENYGSGDWKVPGVFVKFKAIDAEDKKLLQHFVSSRAI